MGVRKHLGASLGLKNNEREDAAKKGTGDRLGQFLPDSSASKGNPALRTHKKANFDTGCLGVGWLGGGTLLSVEGSMFPPGRV